MGNKEDTGRGIVMWAISKTWLHRERREKEPVEIVHLKTMEDMQKYFESWDEEEEKQEQEKKNARKKPKLKEES